MIEKSKVICVILCDCEKNNLELYDLLLPYQIKYSRKCNADFLIIHQDRKEFRIDRLDRHRSINTFNVYDLIGRYERILKIDPDMLIKPNAPNMFDIFQNENMHYCPIRKIHSSGGAACIMILSNNKKYYDLTVLPKDLPDTDDKIQALMFKITQPIFGDIPYEWNNFYHKGLWKIQPDLSHIIHYVGHPYLYQEKYPELCNNIDYKKELDKFKIKCAKEDIEKYCM